MSQGTHPCAVLILTKSSQDGYVIRRTMNITTPKVRQRREGCCLQRRRWLSSRSKHTRTHTQLTPTQIFIGNPIDPPVLNTTRIERLFDVRDGGFLDVRAVQLYKGIGRRFDGGSLVIISGCTGGLAQPHSFAPFPLPCSLPLFE